MSVQDTRDGFLKPDATPEEIRRELLHIADEIRRFGIGNQPERIEEVVKRLSPPRLRGVLNQISHPKTWLTREYALWLAGMLMSAGDLIEELLRDAEITGSERTIEKAREWLDTMELRRKT